MHRIAELTSCFIAMDAHARDVIFAMALRYAMDRPEKKAAAEPKLKLVGNGGSAGSSKGNNDLRSTNNVVSLLKRGLAVEPD